MTLRYTALGVLVGIIAAISLSLLAPPASAYTYCANMSYSVDTSSRIYDGVGHSFQSYNYCPNECDIRSGACKVAEGRGFLIEFYIIIFLLALGLLAASIKLQHWILSMFAMILFAVLGIGGFNIEIMTNAGLQVYGISGIMVMLNWLFLIISFIVLLIGGFNTLKNRNSDRERNGD